MICPDLELGVKPQEEESESSECSSSMSARKRSDGVLDPRLIRLCADFCGVHDLVEADSIQAGFVVRLCERDVGHANIEKIRPETANELFESNLEEGCQCYGPNSPDYSITRIPNRLDLNLSDNVGNDGYRNRDQSREPGGNDPTAIRVGPLGVDDIARRRIESDRECSCNDDGRVVDLGVLAMEQTYR